MTTDEKIKRLEKLISKMPDCHFARNSPQMVEWSDAVRTALVNIFPNTGYEKTFLEILNETFYGVCPIGDCGGFQIEINNFETRCINSAIAFIRAKIQELKDWPDENSCVCSSSSSVLDILRIIERFDMIVKQLRPRHNSRETLNVSDEYDVQDLSHALLKLYFDDIRPEEWTPSYAGKSSRIDFFLPDLELAIETKMTREGLSDKEVGEQLVIDKEYYRKRADVKRLICFVYDPNGRIKNPRGFEKDLSQDGPLKTDVYVRPK